jgi:hypothetical protein
MGREANHLHPCIVEVVNAWSDTSTTPTFSFNLSQNIFRVSLGSSVDIVTRLRARRSGNRLPAGVKDVLFSETSTSALGSTQAPILCVPGFFSGGKAAGA